MEKKKILFVSQEITPYLPETEMSVIGRYLPQGIQEKSREIRAFMPRYGTINERRNQLHEVIRLSGMNLIIDGTDHPLIIKVASIQSARMQVYFIDNDDFFQRKAIITDKEGAPFPDNDERAIFFARGVLETVKKLRWSPDLVHCHGWISSLIPLYLKKAYSEDPLFQKTKVITSVYNDIHEGRLQKGFKRKIKIAGVTDKDISVLSELSNINVSKLALNMSDAMIYGHKEINPEIEKYMIASNKPILEYQTPETYIDAYSDFYNRILDEK